MAMKLSTGKVAFPIEFDNGDKDCIYFNPSDPNLAVRLSDLQDKVKKRLKDAKDMQLNEQGLPEDVARIEEFRNIQNIICEELDTAFDSKVSDVVFKYCSPFAIVNGDYFLKQFIKAIKPEIKKHIKKATADVEKKMQKHIAKYSK